MVLKKLLCFLNLDRLLKNIFFYSIDSQKYSKFMVLFWVIFIKFLLKIIIFRIIFLNYFCIKNWLKFIYTFNLIFLVFVMFFLMPKKETKFTRCKINWKKKDFSLISRFLEFFFFENLIFNINLKIKLSFFFKKKNLFLEKKMLTSKFSKNFIKEKGFFAYKIFLKNIKYLFLIKLFFQKLKKKKKFQWHFLQQLEESISMKSENKTLNLAKNKIKKLIGKNLKFFFLFNDKIDCFKKNFLEILYIFQKKNNLNKITKVLNFFDSKKNKIKKKNFFFQLILKFLTQSLRKKKKLDQKVFHSENCSDIWFKSKSDFLIKSIYYSIINNYKEKNKKIFKMNFHLWNYLLFLFFSNGNLEYVAFLYSKDFKNFFKEKKYKNIFFLLIMNISNIFYQKNRHLIRKFSNISISKKTKKDYCFLKKNLDNLNQIQKKSKAKKKCALICFVLFFFNQLLIKKKKVVFLQIKIDKIFLCKFSIKFLVQNTIFGIFFIEILFFQFYILYFLKNLIGLTFILSTILSFVKKLDKFVFIISENSIFIFYKFGEFFFSYIHPQLMKRKKKYGGKIQESMKILKKNKCKERKNQISKKFFNQIKIKNEFTKIKIRKYFTYKTNFDFRHYNFFITRKLYCIFSFEYFLYGYFFQKIIYYTNLFLTKKYSPILEARLINTKCEKKIRIAIYPISKIKKKFVFYNKIFLRNYENRNLIKYFNSSNLILKIQKRKFSDLFWVRFLNESQLFLINNSINIKKNKKKISWFKEKKKRVFQYHFFFKKNRKKIFFDKKIGLNSDFLKKVFYGCHASFFLFFLYTFLNVSQENVFVVFSKKKKRPNSNLKKISRKKKNIGLEITNEIKIKFFFKTILF